MCSYFGNRGFFSGDEKSPKDVISKESGSIFIKSRVGAKPLPPAGREERLKKTLSQLLIKPDVFAPELEKIARENPTDAIGKQAFEALFDFYKGKQRYHEAAIALISLQRYSEAMLFFLKDPPKYLEAAQSAQLAYGIEKDKTKKRELFIQATHLLLGPVNDKAKALQMIKLWEKDFPMISHPFSYYTKSDIEKIKDLFRRISGYFLNNIESFLDSEFPDLRLMKKPVVEIVKLKDGSLKIIGKYQGDVTLNTDRLKNIYMVLWLVDGFWVVVDTNLTQERKSHAASVRKKLERKSQSASQMLSYLESIFKSEYPHLSLHEIPGKAARTIPTGE